MKNHKNLRILAIFTLDVICGAVLFCIVFATAFVLGELIIWSENLFSDASLTINLAKNIKIIMLICDVFLLLIFILFQTYDTYKLLIQSKK